MDDVDNVDDDDNNSTGMLISP